MESKTAIKLLFVCIFAGLVFINSSVLASSSNGTINATYKYAWSDNLGWINFGTAEGDVHITDAELTGYLWSDNYGWIDLNPSTSGVKNNSEGTLSGSAWGDNTGWINFSGVTIDSSGFFRGTASGDVVGTINFNCNDCQVQTDWISSSTRDRGGSLPGPGGGGVSLPRPIPPYSVSINNGEQYTKSQIVNLNLEAGSDVKRVEISNTLGFENSTLQDYQISKSWDLCGDKEEICKDLIFPPNGLSFTVYVKFYTDLGQPSDIVSDSIILDNQTPEIKITDIKEFYSAEEEIIVSGTSEPNLSFTLDYAGKYGVGHVDSEGRWSFDLGRLPAGNYQLKINTSDPVGNASESTINLTVEEEIEPVIIPPTPPTGPVSKTIDTIKNIWSWIFKPKQPPPEVIVTVPKETPLSLRGQWNIIPRKEINNFVFQPLSGQITALAKKFSGLGRTFKEVGVTRSSDIEKIRTAKLTLPGLTQVVGFSEVAIKPGEISLPKGIPIANLTAQAKSKIPTEIVFARTAGELIDFNITLSLNDKGQPDQIINTIVGKSLELAVRPEKPVKAIKGYVIFKSKKPRPTSFNLPLEALTASLLISDPSVSRVQEEPVNIEDEFVLMEFEYTDPDGDGIYTANIESPVVDGEYEILTVMDYSDPKLESRSIRMITVVDPEGYVYEKSGNKETRVNGAVVSLYYLNPETKQYELWPATEYNQENPQITDVRGTYSFLVPEGYYYLQISSPGYLSYDGKPFETTQGSGVHMNIELRTKYWWIKYADWKNIALAVVILLLLYNFYRDIKRDRIRKATNITQKV